MSRYTTEGKLQATVDFGFQSQRRATSPTAIPPLSCGTSSPSDDYYTDTRLQRLLAADLPRQPRHGPHRQLHLASAMPTRTTPSCSQRDQLGHSLMYLTRGQPVVYYGDEQGFAAELGEPSGVGDQRAREDMFPSPGRRVQRQRPHRHRRHHRRSQLRAGPPALPAHRGLSALRDAHPALADGAQIHRYASGAAGMYAFSRIDAEDQVEYLVATNNAETAKTVVLPTFSDRMVFKGVWPAGTRTSRATTKAGSRVTVPPLSAVVWKAAAPLAKTARDAGAVLPDARGRGAGQRPGRGRRLGAGWRLQPGDLRLAAGRLAGLDRSRHRRQRAVPRLPRRVRHRRGHADRIPRRRGRARR